VPGGNDRMLARALTLPADGLILDLEDAVAPDRKAATRGVVGEWLGRDFGGRERWVRMNPIATGHGRADLEATIAARPDGYVVPKPGRAADVREIVRVLDRLEQKHGIPNGTTRLTLIATETPEGLLNIREIATATPRTVAISWGVEDLGAAMGLGRVRDAEGRYLDIPRYARVMCSVVAAAAGVEAIDTVFTDIADLDGLRRECEEGVDGFHRQDLHPSLPDRRDQRSLHAAQGGGRRGPRAGRAVQRAREARRLRVHLQGPDGGRPAPHPRQEAPGEGRSGVSPATVERTSRPAA